MSDETFVCSLCLSFMSEREGEDRFVSTAEGHVFHYYCLEPVLQTTNPRCPICRENIDRDSLRPLMGINPTATVSRRRNVRQVQNRLQSQAPDYSFHIVLLGNSGVGKTSLLTRFSDGTFRFDVDPTCGMEMCVKNLLVGEKLVRLTVWDSCGQERFNAITRNFVRNAHGALLVFSYGKEETTNTLNEVSKWKTFIEQNARIENVAKIMVGNKFDIPQEQRSVTATDAETKSRELGIKFFDTSARDSYNVSAVFLALTAEILEKVELGRIKSEIEAGNIRLGERRHLKKRKKNKKTNDSSCC